MSKKVNGQTPDEIAEQIAELFERTARAIFWVNPPRAKSMDCMPMDLTFAQGRCLRVLARRENCTLRELSRHLGISASTACELVDRLVRAELVEREDNPQDRRAVQLRLSPKGQDMFARRREEKRTHLRSFLDRLSEPQRASMLSALEALDGVVQQVQQEECEKQDNANGEK